MKNIIYNEDCKQLLEDMKTNNVKADIILTSPPYNTGRKGTDTRNYEHRYDEYTDSRTQKEYIEWINSLFNDFNEVLKPDGVVLWNTSYGTDTTQSEDNISTMFLSVASILQNTDFAIADKITWKKQSALPNNVSPNRLTRICEDVFVFCRKSEMKTYFANKKVSGHSSTGQTFYMNMMNFITAPNNDEKCDLNCATFSTAFCRQLLDMYAPKNALVLDPFMGTGTTAVASKGMGLDYIGSELSKAQCDYANERVKGTKYSDYKNGNAYRQMSLFDMELEER